MTRRTAWGSAWERPISRSARAAGTGCARKYSMSKSEKQERLLQGESLGSGMLRPSTKSTSDALSQAGLRMKQTAGKPAKAARRQKRLLRSRNYLQPPWPPVAGLSTYGDFLSEVLQNQPTKSTASGAALSLAILGIFASTSFWIVKGLGKQPLFCMP